MDSILHSLIVLAHVLIGFYFVFYAFWNIYHWVPLLKMMTERGIPHPYLILAVGIILQAVAGYLIMFGFYVKISAILLAPFTLISAFIFHPFWRFHGEQRMLNLSIFLANVTTTFSALLLLFAIN